MKRSILMAFAIPLALVACAGSPGTAANSDLYMGFGLSAMGRIRPGPTYLVNEVYVTALFDSQGRILRIHLEQLEVAPAKTDSDEAFMSEIASWQTKRQRGDSYMMTGGSWAQQADAFEAFFVGMTVGEIETWFQRSASDVNGRPLRPSSSEAGDAEKFALLSSAEQAALADLTASATMSLNDSHGNIIEAIVRAYENRVPVFPRG